MALLRNILSKGLSTYGSLMQIPNLGFSQGIAQTPRQPVQPAFGLRPMPSFSAYVAAPSQPRIQPRQIPPLQQQVQKPTTSFGQLNQPSNQLTSGGGQQGGGGSGQQDGGQLQGGTQPSSDLSSLFTPQPQAPQIDFDAMIAPAISGLESAIGPLQQGTASDIQSLESQRQATTSRIGLETTGQEAQIGKLKEQQSALGESAADRARRAYAEIQQGLQARYGRSTGTGAFAADLSGRETLRNLADIHGQVSQAIAGLDDKFIQVREVGRIQTQEIENQTRDLISKAKNNLELQLAEIRRQKGELQGRKAELASQSIQLYQNTVQQVNSQNATFKQNLFLSMQDAENKIRLKMQEGQKALDSFTTTNLRFNDQSTPYMYSKTTGKGQFIQQPPGYPATSVNPTDEDRRRRLQEINAGITVGG